MTEQLTKNTDVAGLRERIGVGEDEELRTSTRREQNLQKYACIMAADPTVTVTFNSDIAAVKLDESVENDQIYIPTREFDQEVTDLPEKVYDLLVQETLTTHEIGHILYSDWASIEDLKEQVEDDYQAAFHLIWNAIEDNCIERQLQADFTCRSEFQILNQNMAETDPFGQPLKRDGTDEKVLVYPMVQALAAAIFDYGDSLANLGYGHDYISKLLDPDSNHDIATTGDEGRFEQFLPVVEDAVEKCLREPDAVRRNRLVYDFWQEVKELLDDADSSGIKDAENAQQAMQSGDGDGGTWGRATSDDLHPGIGGQQEQADGGNPGEGGGGVDEDAAKAQYRTELRQEVGALDGGEALASEAENFIDILDGGDQGGPGQQNDSLTIPDLTSDPREETRQQAIVVGRHLENVLRRRLQQAKRKHFKSGQRRGLFDERAMVNAARGSPRCFKARQQEDEKDYRCVVVADRSGSMSSNADELEVALGGFTTALEGLGVDTCVLDFVGGSIRLAKPFGSESDDHAGVLYSGQTTGGTPLSDAMWFARERLQYGTGTVPFIIVITDGKAHNSQSYINEVNKCTFPVFGVYLRQDLDRSAAADVSERQHLSSFDQGRIVTADHDIAAELLALAQGVLL